MDRTRRLFVHIGLLALAPAVLVGCGGGDSPTPAQSQAPPQGSSDINPQARDKLKTGGTLRLAIQQWITQYNVGHVDGQQGDGSWITSLVQPALWFNDEKGVPRLNPDALVSAEVTATSPNQVVTYTINPAATWSDGTPVSWRDFATQWQTNRGTDPAYRVAEPAGYDQISDVARGGDDREVKVTFNKPFSDWQDLFNPLLPGSAIDTPDEFNRGWIEKVPVWGGPWKIGSLDKTAQTITLVPNETYWGTKPVLESVVLRALDAAAFTDAYLNNEIDQAPAREPDAYKRLAGAPDTTIRSGSRWDETHLTLSSKGPLADVRVRQAVFAAVDREAIAKAQTSGLPFTVNTLNNHFFMPTQDGYQDNAGEYGKFDPGRAKSLLDQAGWAASADGRTRGKAGAPLKLTYVVSAASTSKVPQLVQNMLGQVGIEVNLQSVPGNDYFEKYVWRGAFDLVSFRFVDAVFPAGLLSNYLTDGPQNYGKVGNAQIDQLLTAAAAETDRAKAVDLYNQADKLIWQEGASVSLYQTPQISAVRNGLANFGAWGLRDDHQLVDTGWIQ
jgi:peptide/nickel transport system substrate-binding protein